MPNQPKHGQPLAAPRQPLVIRLFMQEPNDVKRYQTESRAHQVLATQTGSPDQLEANDWVQIHDSDQSTGGQFAGECL